MDAGPKYRAPALEKGLDILELLSREETGLTQAEIARRLARSVSEIYRMLMVLEQRGYVALAARSERYMLTTLLFEVANRTPLLRKLTAVAAPVMRRLTAEINQSAHLAVLSGDSVLVVEQVDSRGNNNMSVRLGARIDLWRASSGRVILAFLGAEERQRIMAQHPPPDDLSVETIRADLAGIRRLGHEVRDSFVVRGVTNIAAPVIDHSGHAVAALTVPFIEKLQNPVDFETCRRELVGAARSLTASLGGTPPAAAG